MTRIASFAALLAVGAVLMTASVADAGRVPSTRVVSPVEAGSRGDITVPYTTNGRSTLGVWNGVGPLIVSQPGLGTVNDAQVRPVYNLPFYGGKQSFNSSSVGAIPRQGNSLRRNR